MHFNDQNREQSRNAVKGKFIRCTYFMVLFLDVRKHYIGTNAIELLIYLYLLLKIFFISKQIIHTTSFIMAPTNSKSYVTGNIYSAIVGLCIYYSSTVKPRKMEILFTVLGSTYFCVTSRLPETILYKYSSTQI